MTWSEWTRTPTPNGDDGWDNPYPDGAQVVSREPDVRFGTVVGWATGTDSLAKYQATGDAEWLIDSEGPLVRWDDQEDGDETLDWIPGQGMGCIERLN